MDCFAVCFDNSSRHVHFAILKSIGVKQRLGFVSRTTVPIGRLQMIGLRPILIENDRSLSLRIYGWVKPWLMRWERCDIRATSHSSDPPEHCKLPRYDSTVAYCHLPSMNMSHSFGRSLEAAVLFSPFWDHQKWTFASSIFGRTSVLLSACTGFTYPVLLRHARLKSPARKWMQVECHMWISFPLSEYHYYSFTERVGGLA